MKFHWGVFAFVLFGSFAVFMSGLAIYASMQKYELVTDDYYEKELEFEKTQKKQETTALLSTQIKINIDNGNFVLNFPKEVGNTISGNIVFFKPSSERDDKSINFSTDSNTYKLAIKEFSSGMYKVKINWEANGTKYYNEDQIVIP